MMLRLGEEGLALPAPVNEGKRFAVLGKSGSGKTNTLLVLAREFILAGWTLVIVDAMNNFRHLRTAGLPVLIAGTRASADVQIVPENAATLAEFAFTQRASVIIDASQMERDGMETLEPFLGRLWKLVQSQPEDGPFVPLAVFVDEAQLYIPQSGTTPISPLLIDMAKRGRQLHVSMAISSQRPASLQKDFLTQSHVMIFHALRGVDIGPVRNELAMKEQDARELMQRFAKGQAIVVGDPDMVTAQPGEDYAICQVRSWGGTLANGATLDLDGGRRIDAEALDKLRLAMTKPADPNDVPAQIWARRIEDYKQQALTVRRQYDELVQALAAAYTATCGARSMECPPAQALAEITALVEQMRAVPVAVPALVSASANGHGDAAGGAAPAIGDWDGRSALATQRAVKKQEREFEGLIKTINDQMTMHRRILVYLSQRAGTGFSEAELARFLGYSLGTLQNQRPTMLKRMGLLTYEHSPIKRGWMYRTTIAKYLAEHFPDLDKEVLLARINKLEKL
ncbi:MAG: DUF87 domain-containing protein [Anaerolineae bacterium]|nr:DUF87 domain-containing protein [Anaerolineae bacterium]